MNKKGKKGRIVIMLLIFLLSAVSALATYLNEPTPPNDGFTVVSSERRAYVGTMYKEAEAGNVSELSMTASVVTRGWQGYYGNITGTIVLDDALNNSMYTWDLADPEGEVYASRDNAINWSDGNIICADISHIVTEESTFNFNGGVGQDVDGINETFNESSHPAFTVGNNTFTASECDFTVSTYVDDAPAGVKRYFNETILKSQSDDFMVYMAFIIQGGADGFKNNIDANYDFQMLVPEDGHDGDTSTTNYYFWVELE